MHPLKRWQRRVTAQLAKLYENGPQWQAIIAGAPPRPSTWSDRLRTFLGLPLFNRRVGQYHVGQNNPATLTQLGSRAGWKVDWAEVAPGVRLTGAVSAPRDPSAPWVLYFLGNWGDQLVKSQIWLEQLRGAHDWGLATWAPRGFETSSGTPNVHDACVDARLLHDLLIHRYGARADGIHPVGFSLGAILASALTSTLAQAGKPPASLTLLSMHPYGFSVRRSAARWISHWQVPEWFAPMVDPKWLPGPTLVIHAQDDPIERVEETRRFVASLGQHCRYVELPDGGHEGPIGTAAIRQIRAFIEEIEVHAA